MSGCEQQRSYNHWTLVTLVTNATGCLTALCHQLVLKDLHLDLHVNTLFALQASDLLIMKTTF